LPDIDYKFMVDPATGRSPQSEFFYDTKRNQCFSGGYGNGKTYVGCQKSILLLSTFPKYRMAILRATAADLKRTTMATFFKICQPEMYADDKGGKRTDSLNYLRLINGSEVFWMHLDDYDENVVRGLEINSYLIDQGEEVDENIYLHLDSRLDRWDMSEIPDHLDPERFPKNRATGRPKPPSYGMVLCNPDVKAHWIYRRFHPDSAEHNEIRYRTNRTTGKVTKYTWSDTHSMVQASSYENPALSQETLDVMEARGKAFVKRFVMGEWGSSGGSIFEIPAESKLYNVPQTFLDTIMREGTLYRAMDHGDAAPTVCLWICVWKKWMFIYREYYKAGHSVSQHRENIAFMQMDVEQISQNFADPAIFSKTQQKKGGISSVAEEWSSAEYLPAPPIHWYPADNNEILTRSRLRESLMLQEKITHPVTGKTNAPRLYFIMKTQEYPSGCNKCVLETESQKYKKLYSLDGDDVFGDDRDDKVVDHAYDALKYGNVCIVTKKTGVHKFVVEGTTFNDARQRAMKQQRKFRNMAGIQPHSFGHRV